MGNEVYANARSVSCKAGNGMVSGGFPDVCLSPPSPPAGPVPIPYPLFSSSSDTTDGSKTVKVGGQEIMLKNKSYFKKCTGDEAATKSLGQGVITHTLGGKVYFVAWSMDVRVEGENIVRHLDLMTSNHASPVANESVPMVETEKMSPAEFSDQCKLRPYKEGCPPPKTAHHCVPDHCFKTPGKDGTYYPGAVEHADGLCVCVEGQTKSSPRGDPAGRIKREDYGTDSAYYGALADHGRIHAKFDKMESELGNKGDPKNSASLGDLEDNAAKVVSEVTGCDEEDLKKQMRNHHQSKGLGSDTKLRADPAGRAKNPPPYAQMGRSNATELAAF